MKALDKYWMKFSSSNFCRLPFIIHRWKKRRCKKAWALKTVFCNLEEQKKIDKNSYVCPQKKITNKKTHTCTHEKVDLLTSYEIFL